jgi:hypothetical protein
MPGIQCTCGERISYGEIPCPHEWLFVSDKQFEEFSGQIDAEEVYRTMRSFLRCPSCGRLWVFWNGFQNAAEEFVPVAAGKVST